MVDMKRQYLNFLASGLNQLEAEDEHLKLVFDKRTRAVNGFDIPTIPVLELRDIRFVTAKRVSANVTSMPYESMDYLLELLQFVEDHNPRAAVYLCNITNSISAVLQRRGYQFVGSDPDKDTFVNMVKIDARHKLRAGSGKGKRVT